MSAATTAHHDGGLIVLGRDWQRGEGTDCDAVANGLVSVTPLQLDLTDFEALENKAPW